ncbi:MAG: orotidine 5'-phosphate decarboxylase, partial [Proteobacteria bacterium]|nr:orotidine 5'-phosphate decarboxylase [Pseudomonadota bacterium]
MPAKIPNQDRLIVALDFPTIQEAKNLVNELGDAVSFYKIGLELCMGGEYFELVEWLGDKNKK